MYIHVHEVEVERDADEEHARDEDREGRLLEEGEGVEPEDFAEANVFTGLLRWRVRKGEREKSQRDGNCSSEIELHRGLFAFQHDTERNATRDPADGGERFYEREIALRVFQMVK